MFGDKDKDKSVKNAPATKENSMPGKGATLIANNTRLEGDIHFSDQLLVNGEIKGNVYAEQDSEIRVPNVVVNGRVKGDIYAGKHVELAAEARVEGNVFYHLIEMVVGARVDGSLVYTPPDQQPAARTPGRVPTQEVPAVTIGTAQS